MKLSHLGYVCFTLSIYLLDAKDVRQIGSLVPLDDWLDFKNRTRDINPLDKLIGKLRATYDFVFHKAENVSNVGKILGKVAKEDLDGIGSKMNLTDSWKKENVSDIVDVVPVDEKESTHLLSSSSFIGKASLEPKLSSNRWLYEGLERRLDKLETLEEALPLSHLELIDNDNTENFNTEALDSTMPPYISKFHLPYAVAQAFLRWLISLYYSTYSNLDHTDSSVRENA